MDLMDPTRHCGHCSLCCKIMEVPEVKPRHDWCPHARPGTGCAIYRDRPQPCRDFLCRWLMDDTVPDYWYPARCKIIIDFAKDPLTMCFIVDPAYKHNWRKEPYFTDIKKWARYGIEGGGWATAVLIKDERIAIGP
jgi:hypothetical protein